MQGNNEYQKKSMNHSYNSSWKPSLILNPCQVDAIRVGDELSFHYSFAKNNPPARVGMVIEFVGRKSKGNLCVKLWDYTVNGFRNYRMDGIQDLRRIDQSQFVRTANWDWVKEYKQNIDNFTKEKRG